MPAVKTFSEFCKSDLNEFLLPLENDRKSVAKTGIIGLFFFV
jgi:hypothetical protein